MHACTHATFAQAFLSYSVTIHQKKPSTHNRLDNRRLTCSCCCWNWKSKKKIKDKLKKENSTGVHNKAHNLSTLFRLQNGSFDHSWVMLNHLQGENYKPSLQSRSDYRSTLIKGAVSRYTVIFCAFFVLFCASKQWRLLAQMSRTSDHDSSVSRANNFTAQAESSKYHFPRPCLVAAIIFPHTKWLPKITDYRDT